MSVDYTGFANWLSRNDRRNTTIKRHVNSLRHLEKNNVPLTKEAVESHLVKLKSEGKQGSYLNSYVFALKLYGQFTNTDLKLKEFRRSTSVKSTLSDDEIDAFLRLPRRKNQPPHHFRKMTFFWSLIADTGLRPGECAILKPKHFDFGRGVIIIETSKTNTPGQVPIPTSLIPTVTEYLSDLSPEDYLFPSARGGSSYTQGEAAVLNNVAWHFDFKKRLEAMNLKRPHLTPYSFRHTYATRLLEEDISLFHVKKLMRHKDLKSTLVYEHLTTKDLIKAQSRLPRIRRTTDPLNILDTFSEIVREFQFDNDLRFSEEFKKNLGDLIYEEARRLRQQKD